MKRYLVKKGEEVSIEIVDDEEEVGSQGVDYESSHEEFIDARQNAIYIAEARYKRLEKEFNKSLENLRFILKSKEDCWKDKK